MKTIIEGAKGFAAAQQKLIFAGKILADETTLADAKVVDGSFFVCMISKPKKAAAAPAEAAPAGGNSLATGDALAEQVRPFLPALAAYRQRRVFPLTRGLCWLLPQRVPTRR